LSEGVSVVESENLKIRAKENIDFYGKICNNFYENYKLDSENIWIGNSSKILIGESGMELRGKRLRYEGSMIMELSDNFLLGKTGNNFRMDDKSFSFLSKNLDYNFMVDLKGEVIITPSKNLRLESTLGDIFINTQGGFLKMDGIGKVININSDGDMINRVSKRLTIQSNEYRLNSKEMNIYSNDINIGSKKIGLVGEESMILSGGSMEVYMEKIGINSKEEYKIRSEKYGNIYLDGKGLEINVKGDVKIGGSDYKLDFLGNGGMKYGGNMEIEAKGRMLLLVEEGIKIGTKSDLELIGREGIRVEGREIFEKCMEKVEEIGRKRVNMRDYELDIMNMRINQSGYGEFKMETEGRISIINKLEAHSSRVIELNVESNSHDDSMYIGSRMGGIWIDAQKVRIGGEVILDRIKTDRLRIDGDMEVGSVRVGNMFLNGGGISFLSRDVMEMRNMDLKLDGELIVNKIRVDKLEAKNRFIEMDGGLRVGKMDCMGIKIGGNFIGDVGERSRDYMSVNIGDTVWNTGIRIKGGEIGMEIDGSGLSMRTGGKVEVGGMDIWMEMGGEMEELEEDEIRSIKEELRVERVNGRLRMVNGGKKDLGQLLMKMMALIMSEKNI